MFRVPEGAGFRWGIAARLVSGCVAAVDVVNRDSSLGNGVELLAGHLSELKIRSRVPETDFLVLSDPRPGRLPVEALSRSFPNLKTAVCISMHQLPASKFVRRAGQRAIESVAVAKLQGLPQTCG